MEAQTIPGYSFGAPEVARSPVTADDVELLKATLLWSDEDDRYLRMAGDVLRDQVDDVLELWYGYVASHPHLVHYFSVREIALRYLVAFIFPITATMRQFLANKGHAPDDVEGMHTAWFKAVAARLPVV